MDEVVIKTYRRLLREGFRHSGAWEHPSIFLDSREEKVALCGDVANFMEIYVNITDNRVTDIKYTCSCEPTTNVAVEILCALVNGQPLSAVISLSDVEFYQYLGSRGEEFGQKARALLEMLNRGIARYRNQSDIPKQPSLYPNPPER